MAGVDVKVAKKASREFRARVRFHAKSIGDRGKIAWKIAKNRR